MPAPTLPSVQGVPVLAMPKTLLGRAPSTDLDLKAIAKNMVKNYAFDPPPLVQIGVAYGMPAKRNQIIAMAFSSA